MTHRAGKAGKTYREAGRGLPHQNEKEDTMVHQKFTKGALFRKMLKSSFLRYTCLPLADGRAEKGDLIVFQEADRGEAPTGRLLVARVLSVVEAESELGPRIVLELELNHTQGVLG